MSNNIRRAKNYIRESDLPRKADNSQESFSSLEDENIGNRVTKDGTSKPTASELEEAQLLIGAAGSIGEEQIVIMMNESEVNQEETTGEGDEEEPKPEVSDEELKRELQELLDSQLNPEETDSASKHLMGRREQVFETEDEAANEYLEPSKGFTDSEIQAFMNNQIRKQHQLHIQGEQVDKVAQRSHQQPQQHLILVTSNGDKIILIQNPNEVEREESEQSDYQPNFDITEEEERQILLQHKQRQQMLLVLLDKLREQHMQRLPSTVTTPAVPHLQPIKLVPYKPKVETSPTMVEVTETNTASDTNGPARPRTKQSKGSRKKAGGPPKWLKPVSSYLNMAVNYMKRREDKVDEIARMFPSASASFGQKCQNMKQELMNIELTIERFQNTIGNDLEEVSTKFKSFLREFDLENCLDELEAGDEIDEFDSNMFEVEDVEPKIKSKKGSRKTIQVSANSSSGMQLITPSNISITSTTSESMVFEPTPLQNREADPFDFTQDPESMIDIKPIVPSAAAIKTGLVSKLELQNSNHDRPVRSARLQNKRHTKDAPILPPTKSKRMVRR